MGLGAVLEWLADDMRKKFGLSIALQSDYGIELRSSDLRIFLYESARELLFNVVKHAKAKSATLRVARSSGDVVCIEVRDKGVGMKPNPRRRTAFGLFSIRERAEALDGRLDVVSAPGKGTRVTLTVPNR
jgi:signal transduction histidine kinase